MIPNHFSTRSRSSDPPPTQNAGPRPAGVTIPPEVAVALAVTDWWLVATGFVYDGERLHQRALPPPAELLANQAFDTLTDFMAGRERGASYTREIKS